MPTVMERIVALAHSSPQIHRLNLSGVDKGVSHGVINQFDDNEELISIHE
jgi:hypothetical protein